jgi:hypothetical protein
MILTERELDSYRVGRFAVELPTATLTQRGAISTPEVLSGPASLRQAADGRITLTLYGSRENAKEIRSSGGRKPGSWIEESETYDLLGRDFGGRAWTAQRLHLTESSDTVSRAVICSAEVRELHCTREYSRELPNILWAWFPGSFRLPVNTYTITKRTVGSQTTEGFDLNVWEFATGDRSVLLLRHDDAIELEVASDSTIPSAYHTRLQEALWLTLARRVEPSVVVLQNGRDVRARLTPLLTPVGQPRLQPPLDLRDPQYADAAAKLVTAYLAATQSHDSNELYYHPLGVAVSRVLKASQVDVEMEALVLSTVLEGLAGDYFTQFGAPDDELVTAVDIAVQSIPTDSRLDKHRDRMLNALNKIKRKTGRSALGRLAVLGVITADQHKAWNHIRHRLAHGERRKDPARAFGEMCNTIHTALYRLVFEVVRYSGPYRDFGTLGWPSQEYHSAGVLPPPGPSEAV